MILYCPICGKPVYFAERKRSLGKDYHPLCLKCFQCKRQLTAGQHAEVVYDIRCRYATEVDLYWYDDKPFCNRCYLLHFGPRARGPAHGGSLGPGTSLSSSSKQNQNKS